jgi:hypothetical protein
MAPQYIPAGRTSIVKKGKSEFQLQTEYAAMPQPRITTTIFAQGRVLHKIEKSINRTVETVEEMHLVEDIIKTQHLEISRIIRERGLPSQPDSIVDVPQELTRSEQMRRMDEVEQVFRITFDGRLADDSQLSDEFKKFFKHIIKELPQMMMVFASIPGKTERREEGIYELEPGRILLISTGIEYFLILLKPGTPYETVAGPLKQIFDI